MPFQNRVVELLTDDKCKFTHVRLADCPTSLVVGPALTRNVALPTSVFTPDNTKVYVVKCPHPEAPPTDDDDLPTTNSPGIFFIDSMDDLRIVPFLETPPPWPSQKIDDISTLLSNTTLHIQSHHANKHIYTLETDSFNNYVRRRTYTVNEGVYSLVGAAVTLGTFNRSSAPFPVTLKLDRKRGFIYSVFEEDPSIGQPTTIRQYDLFYNFQKSIVSKAGGIIWYACPDPDRDVIWAYHDALNLTTDRYVYEYDINTLVETEIAMGSNNPGPNIPSPGDHADPTFADLAINTFFDLDQSIARRWAYPSGSSRTDSPVTNGQFLTYVRNSQKLISGEVPDEMWMEDYTGGNAVKIWDASEEGLSIRTANYADSGID